MKPCLYLQISDANEEAKKFIADDIDPPWLKEVFINREIGVFHCCHI